MRADEVGDAAGAGKAQLRVYDHGPRRNALLVYALKRIPASQRGSHSKKPAPVALRLCDPALQRDPILPNAYASFDQALANNGGGGGSIRPSVGYKYPLFGDVPTPSQARLLLHHKADQSSC
jgi:hypothetical protein